MRADCEAGKAAILKSGKDSVRISDWCCLQSRYERDPISARVGQSFSKEVEQGRDV